MLETFQSKCFFAQNTPQQANFIKYYDIYHMDREKYRQVYYANLFREFLSIIQLEEKSCPLGILFLLLNLPCSGHWPNPRNPVYYLLPVWLAIWVRAALSSISPPSFSYLSVYFLPLQAAPFSICGETVILMPKWVVDRSVSPPRVWLLIKKSWRLAYLHRLLALVGQ